MVTVTPGSGTPPVFTDNPLTAGGTVVKAVHITELRDAINQARSRAGLAVATWTDSSLSGVVIKGVHLTELRTKLDEARAALGLSAATYTDTSLSGVMVKGVPCLGMWQNPQNPKIRGPETVVPEGDPRATDPKFAAVEYTAPTSVDRGAGPITTTETPIATTLSPSVGPRSGPAPEVPPAGASRTGLFGVELGAFAAIGYGGISAVEASYALGINASGNGGIGGAGLE